VSEEPAAAPNLRAPHSEQKKMMTHTLTPSTPLHHPLLLGVGSYVLELLLELVTIHNEVYSICQDQLQVRGVGNNCR
jgi:hypothetical protein